MELHNRGNNTVPRGHGIERRRPRRQSVLHLGLDVRVVLHLRVPAHPGDERPDARTGRSHVGGDDAEDEREMGPAQYVCGGYGSDGEGDARAGDYGACYSS